MTSCRHRARAILHRRITGWTRFGRVALCSFALSTVTARADTNSPAASVPSDGTLAIAGVAEVPSMGATGKWIEMPGKSSDEHLTRHFMFLVPDQAPPLELYLAWEPSRAVSDGTFETGLVDGYVNGFAGKAGFKAADVKFEDCAIGGAKARRCKVQLSRDKRTLWIYAYVFARSTSLVFVSVRPESDAQPVIERYLATVRLL